MQAGSIAKRKKRIGEVIAYALSHRTRVLILLALNEGTYTPGQVAEMIDEPVQSVSNHIRDMVAIGSIELVKTVKRRNMAQNHYRAIEMPCYTEEDMEAMTPQQRDVTWGLIIQSMAAEMMAALWQGTLRENNKTILSWRWHNVDAEGELEIYTVLEQAWERVWQIECDSMSRVAKTKAKTRSILVALGAFKRAKKGPGRHATSVVMDS